MNANLMTSEQGISPVKGNSRTFPSENDPESTWDFDQDWVATITFEGDSYQDCSSDDSGDHDSVWSTCAQMDTTPHTLSVLNQCRQVMSTGEYNIFGLQSPIHTHFDLEEWAAALSQYDDKEILTFLIYGWPVNRARALPDPVCAQVNHICEPVGASPVDNYLAKEVDKGAMIGPFQEVPFQTRVGISPMNIRERPGELMRPRIILD